MLAKLFPGCSTKRVIELEIDDISPNPSQPRKNFDIEHIEELAGSISQYGLIQPITVRRDGNGGYQLVAGERRLRASKRAGLKKIPAIVMDIDDRTSAMLALIENLQRKNLNFFEEAYAIERLIKTYKLTQEELAKKLSKSQPSIANKLRLLRLCDKEQKIILENNLTERHARALLRLNDEKLRNKTLNHIIDKKLNVQDSERYIENLLEKQNAPVKGKKLLYCRDIRLFTNTINHALSIMRKSGIKAVSQKEETDAYIEYTIKIPKEQQRSTKTQPIPFLTHP